MYRNPSSYRKLGQTGMEAKPSPIRILQVNATAYEFVLFRPPDFKNLIGPGVYAAVIQHRDRNEWLYIGSAKNILQRISDDAHKSLREAMTKPNVELLVFLCRSEMHARTMESDLIACTMPALNIVGKAESSPSVKALREQIQNQLP